MIDPTTHPGRPHWWSVQPARTDRPVISTRQAYAEVLTVYAIFFAASIAVAGFSLAGPLPNDPPVWSAALPGTIEQVAQTVACVMLPLLLVARRGGRAGDLGVARPGLVPPSVGIRMAAWGLLALALTSAATEALATGSYHVGRLNGPNMTLDLAHAAQAGFIEEVVVLAFVVTTLEQARRPRSEIIVVAMLLRLGYHIYYGPGVIGIAIFGAGFLWLYLRFRTIVPLIALHSTWDVCILLDYRWRSFAGIFGLACLGLLVVAFVSWISARNGSPRPPWDTPALWDQGSPSAPWPPPAAGWGDYAPVHPHPPSGAPPGSGSAAPPP